MNQKLRNMKYSVFSIIIILLFIKVPNAKMIEGSQLDVASAEFQSISPRLKNDGNTHFLFHIHDAINSVHAQYLKMLMNETFLMEQCSVKSNISQRCIQGLKDFSLGLKEKRIWALMMVDSCGSIPSGILEGAFYSTGDFDQCIDSNVTGKFQGQYCEVGVIQNTHFPYKSGNLVEPMDLSYVYETNQSKVWDYDDKFPNGLFPVTTSICLPSTCSIEEVKYLISKVSRTFEEFLKMDVSKCLVKTDRQYTSGEKLVMTIIIVIIALEVMATIMDICSNASVGENTEGSETNLLRRTALCFSLRAHLTKFLELSSYSNSVKIFNALRFISSVIVIQFHDFAYNRLQMAQFRQVYILWSSFPIFVIWESVFQICTFFFMSGFLALYNNTKSRNSSLNFVQIVLKRHLRLWAPAFFVFGCSFFFLNMSQGPNWSPMVEQIAVGNRHNWWQNLLCINNLFPFPEQFLHWTWYLGVEMQLYILAYFILLIYRKHPSIAIRIIGIITVTSLFFLAFRQYSEGFPPVMPTAQTKFSATYYAYENHIYATSLHIAPFCVGMLTSHLISVTEDLQMSKVVKMSGWFLATIFAYVCWFLPHIWDRYLVASVIESVVFGSVQRFLWSLSLAWITFLYFRKEGGFVVSLLSWKGFAQLGKLSFMAYLIQSPFIRFKSGVARNQHPLTLSSHLSSTLVNTTATYLMAFIMHLVCEAPLNSLINLLFAGLRGSKKAKKNQ